jgi:drug/metabolite transporter (DMT)-like permease
MKAHLVLSKAPWGKGLLPTTELLLLLVALFWGTSYGITKSALGFASVFLFLSIRFLSTFVLLLYPTVRAFRAHKNADWLVSLPTGLILFIIFSCEVAGVAMTTATNAVFLISLSAIMTVFIDILVNRSPLDRRLLVLASVSVLGVYLLIADNSLALNWNLGDGLILLAALFRALMVTLTKRLTQGKRLTTTSLTALQSLVVGLGSLIVLLTQGESAMGQIPTEPVFWWLMAYLVLFCTLFAFFVQNYAVRQTSPARVAILMGSEPLFGAVFAMAWLGEVLTGLQALGALLILVSVILASKRGV